MRELLRLFHEKAHFEHLPTASIRLGAEIGDIEMVLSDELQNTGYAAGNIPQLEFYQKDRTVCPAALEISDFSQLLRGQLQPFRLPISLNK